MTENENFKRRIHAYIAFGGLPVSIVLLALLTLIAEPLKSLRLDYLTDLPFLLCLVPFVSTGFMMRRYMPRAASLTAGLISILIYPVGWVWFSFFLRDWYTVNRLERMGFRQALAFCFAFPFGSRQQMARRTRALDNEGLILAYQLPDHTPAAKAMLEREIKARGLTDQIGPNWLPTPARSTVPPNVFRVTSAAAYRSMGLRKESAFRILRFVTISIILSLPFLALMYYVIAQHRPEFGQRLSFVFVFIGYFVSGALVMPVFLTTLYFTYCVLAFAFGGFYFRNHSGRVLLLRPFGQRNMTLPLKNVVWWYLAPYGHVFTLSDQNYKPNIFLDFLFKVFGYLRLIIGPVLRPSYRIGSVKTEHSYFQFADYLTKKYWLSLLSLTNGSQAFNVRTTDEWWKSCVNLLLNSCDIIVMDISRISGGSAWEVERLAKTGFIKNCIFIVQESYVRDGMEALGRLLPAGVKPNVFVYRESGEMQDVNGFELALHDRFNRALATWGKSWTARPKQTASTIVPVFPGNFAPKNNAESSYRPPEPGGDAVNLIPLKRGVAPLGINRVSLYSPQGIVIGRGSQADVVVANDSLSKAHARVSINSGGQVSVEDLASRNGTWKGGQRIERTVLADGDIVRFGDAEYRVALNIADVPGQKPAGIGSAFGQIVQDLNAVAQGNFRGPAAPDMPLNGAGGGRAAPDAGWLLSGADEAGRAIRYHLQPRPGAAETTWTVGRSRSSVDLPIDHTTVSGVHARLRYTGERGLEICDLGSQNGTRADGARVGGNYVTVTKSRQIEFGGALIAIDRA